MKRLLILTSILIVLIVVTLISHLNTGDRKEKQEIIKKGNIIYVPVGMVTDGAPPGIPVGP